LDIDFYRKHWYADIYEQQENQTNDVKYILSTIGAAPKRVLEIACGGGRILEPLARAGHDVTGFDMDEAMLEKCRTRIRGLKNAVCYAADAITADWGTGYEVVVMGGNLLVNIVADMPYAEAQRLLIRKSAFALAENGRLFLSCDCRADFPTSSDPGEHVIFSGKDDWGTEGQYILFAQQNDGETRMNRSKRRLRIVTGDGRESTVEWDVTKHFPSFSTIRNWLSEAGLLIESAAGDFLGNPITDQTSQAVIWARKSPN
jgi:SAM-dependent methyltransferase